MKEKRYCFVESVDSGKVSLDGNAVVESWSEIEVGVMCVGEIDADFGIDIAF